MERQENSSAIAGADRLHARELYARAVVQRRRHQHHRRSSVAESRPPSARGLSATPVERNFSIAVSSGALYAIGRRIQFGYVAREISELSRAGAQHKLLQQRRASGCPARSQDSSGFEGPFLAA